MEKIHWLRQTRAGFFVATVISWGVALSLFLMGNMWGPLFLLAGGVTLAMTYILFILYSRTDPIYENICDSIRVGHTGRRQIYDNSRMSGYSHDAIDAALRHMVEKGWLSKRMGVNDLETYFSFTGRYKKYFPYERIPSIDEARMGA